MLHFWAQALHKFPRSESGSNAIEFSILCLPFVTLLIGIIQVSVYFMAQASLDTGVTRTAEAIRAQFYNSTLTSFPNAATLKADVATESGGMISNTSALSVEIRQLTSLTSAGVSITDGTNDYGTSTSVLALRARANIASFLPGIPAWPVISSALLRRQGR